MRSIFLPQSPRRHLSVLAQTPQRGINISFVYRYEPSIINNQTFYAYTPNKVEPPTFLCGYTHNILVRIIIAGASGINRVHPNNKRRLK